MDGWRDVWMENEWREGGITGGREGRTVGGRRGKMVRM